MWAKSFAGILGGLLISILSLATFYYTLPLPADAKIMIGLITGWIIWAGVMVWCYSSESGKQAWKRASIGVLSLAVLNAALVLLKS